MIKRMVLALEEIAGELKQINVYLFKKEEYYKRRSGRKRNGADKNV